MKSLFDEILSKQYAAENISLPMKEPTTFLERIENIIQLGEMGNAMMSPEAKPKNDLDGSNNEPEKATEIPPQTAAPQPQQSDDQLLQKFQQMITDVVTKAVSEAMKAASASKPMAQAPAPGASKPNSAPQAPARVSNSTTTPQPSA